MNNNGGPGFIGKARHKPAQLQNVISKEELKSQNVGINKSNPIQVQMFISRGYIYNERRANMVTTTYAN